MADPSKAGSPTDVDDWDGGNLLIATGDNCNPFLADGYAPLDERPGREAFDAQRTAANSASLMGKILRIKPRAGGGYSIPAGNLFPPGTPKTSPEIFIMGVRNPYRLAWDRVGKRLYWGEPGPDAVLPSRQHGPAGLDEINQAVGPGFFGWPYFCGSNLAYPHIAFGGGTSRPPEVAMAPMNLSPNNTGIQSLPPAQPAFLAYGHLPSKDLPVLNGHGGPTALAGPVYRYDPQLVSPHKLPRSLDNHLFIFDWNRSWIITAPLDDDEKLKLGDDGRPLLKRFCPEYVWKRPVDVKVGPDGCLYVIEYGSYWGGNPDTRIVKVEWHWETEP